MPAIRNAADALAALDALLELEAMYDSAIPAEARQRAEATRAAGKAWIDAHPTEVEAERAARREALRSDRSGFDAWARSLPRRPSAELKRRIVG